MSRGDVRLRASGAIRLFEQAPIILVEVKSTQLPKSRMIGQSSVEDGQSVSLLKAHRYVIFRNGTSSRTRRCG
jgi:hypothetical protein